MRAAPDVLARDIMSSPVVTAAPAAPVGEAAALLASHRVGTVPVVDDRDQLVGIVSEVDLIGGRYPADSRWEDGIDSGVMRLRKPATVAEAMTVDVRTVSPVATVAEIAEILVSSRCSAVPVIDGRTVVGIVARRDVLRTIATAHAPLRGPLGPGTTREERSNDMGKLDDRRVLITGGARGIGAAIARLFVAEGAEVLVTDVLDDEGQALAATLAPRARYRHLDVTEERQWHAVLGDIAATAPLDVLVNNAGIVAFAGVEQQELEDFQRVIDINLVGPWLGMHVTGPSLRRAHGAVLNVSSTAGLMGYGNLGAYVASKWGLRGLTKAAALEFAPDGVRVCSIHPGPIRTPMTAGFGDDTVLDLPIPRFGEPDEVASMALFVAADATFTTGSEFVVDGGATTGSQIVEQTGARQPAGVR